MRHHLLSTGNVSTTRLFPALRADARPNVSPSALLAVPRQSVATGRTDHHQLTVADREVVHATEIDG